MRKIVSAFVVGLIFGLGLVVSQMVNPAKVLGFLDLFGRWDPSLALVMAGAIPVAALGFFAARRLGQPVFGEKLELATRRDLDVRLVAGSVVFGLGWGLAGFCPGPAVTALASGLTQVLVFVAAMLAGMLLFRLTAARRPSRDLVLAEAE